MSQEFEISNLLKISENQKYASTVAGFKVIDLLDQVGIPKKYENRKPAVQAMIALSEEMVRWDYISDEQRFALEEELRSTKKSHSALDEVFSTATGAAPVSDESDEDLDEIGETAPVEEFVDDTSSDFAADDDSEDSKETVLAADDDDDDDSDDDSDDEEETEED